MCGIVGFIDTKVRPEAEGISKMISLISHRGPDAAAFWIDEQNGVAFGHARLSILDLSPLGVQPMFSETGRFVIIFNGEVYNFKALTQELSALGHHFRGGSDTEVMLAAFEQWGIEGATQRFIGMFAFAVWDRKLRRIYLVRDRLGVKPMYYGWNNGAFIFGSDLHSFRGFSRWQGSMSNAAAAMSVRYSYVPAPFSMFEGCYKLNPGSILSLAVDACGNEPSGFSPECGDAPIGPKQYWQAPTPGSSNSHLTDAEAVEQLRSLLEDSVRLRMLADVPLGAFLSGGVDSSAVVAVMQSQSSRPVRTFSIGFPDFGFDESTYARKVAEHIGTDHTELMVTEKEALDVIPALARVYDEPFADSSQIPTCLVSRLARNEVTVALSGDGGDELFSGYDRYRLLLGVWVASRRLPSFMRKTLAETVETIPLSVWDGINRALKTIPGFPFALDNAGEKLRRVTSVIKETEFSRYYRRAVSHWLPEAGLIRNVEGVPELQPGLAVFPNLTSMGRFDLTTYLPDDILVKVDRATMAFGLEGREPLLDHRIVEFAMTLPDSFKLRNGVSKWVLRQLLYSYVPRELIERPKKGFSVPMDRWLRGALKDWGADLLSNASLQDAGILNTEIVKNYWNAHQNGRRNVAQLLWNVIMLQAWRRETAGPAQSLAKANWKEIIRIEAPAYQG